MAEILNGRLSQLNNYARSNIASLSEYGCQAAQNGLTKTPSELMAEIGVKYLVGELLESDSSLTSANVLSLQ